jgi:hypothetical protein
MLMSLSVAGCGGGPHGADGTARAWVKAINAQDWGRACELSVKDSQPGCIAATSEGFRDARGKLRIASMRHSGGKTLFAVTAPAPPRGKRWTGYAPIEFAVEPHGGKYLVHFEVAVIH